MGNRFSHLTKTKRICLESYLNVKLPVKKIAELLNVHVSTIYREIKRGEYEKKVSTYDADGDKDYKFVIAYSSDLAQSKYETFLKAKGPDIKLVNDYSFAEYIERKIVDDKLTPTAVLGEIKRKNLRFDTSICVSTLYSYIYKGVFSRLSMKHLPIKSKKKNKNRQLVIKRAPKGTSIELRPLEISERKTFGHWEMDCVCGPTLSTLLVLTERLTRKEIIMLMPNQTNDSVVKALNSLERKYGKLFKTIFKSITVDNGSEFSNSIKLETSIYGKNNSRTKLYYCHPYCSSERGTNERINREIRRLIPKGTDLNKVDKQYVSYVENWVNNYPRQVLNFYSSAELFEEQINLLA